VTQTL